MLWSVITIGLVGGIGSSVGFWMMKQFFSNGVEVTPAQKGTLYGGFWEDLEIASPHHHNED